MPLLALPYEILFEILKEVELVSDPASIDLALRPVASTCKLLRSLSIRHIYETLSVMRLRDLEMLPIIFASHQEIASSVRHLAFGFLGDSVEKANNWPLEDVARKSIDSCREILRCCNQIRTLYIEAGDKKPSSECRLDSYSLHTDGMSSLLEHINPTCTHTIDRLVIERFSLKKMFSYFKVLEKLSNLRTLWLLKCHSALGNPLVSWGSSLKLFPSLHSVRDFRFQLELPTLSGEAETALGVQIALALPNVDTLALDTSFHCINGVLQTYAKNGSNIKSLQLEPPLRRPSETTPDFSDIHLCDSIATLSPKLVNIQICLGRKHSQSTIPFCHKMFDGKWPQLEELWYSGYPSTCSGIDREQLRENLDRIAKSRRTAALNISCHTQLLCKNAELPEYYLADTEIFSYFGHDGQEEMSPVLIYLGEGYLGEDQEEEEYEYPSDAESLY